ncbi:MAG: BamA/TamA family outer membrane protein, partial [Thermoanaerobaculia bacterium]|nr:BamA/TamA family outer membrane protein [Thermoanaerobaculia bacterium]
FSIDLYLADARSGKVLRRLVSASADPHFDALRFIDSAGSWSPDGRKFAFVVFEKGDNTLAILDVDSGNVEKRIAIKTVGAVSSPAWGPDGRSIIFSGMKGGISDLYILDVETSEVRQLTDDRYAEMQPEWSPDGSRVIFVTDRGPGTDFEELTYDRMSLATLDVGTGNIQVLSIFPHAKHINPQFAPDGTTVYFISNPEGVNDIYSYSLTDGSVRRITDVRTGVSGITEMSPALSVASDTGRMMFSVFENSDFNIYGFSPDLVPSDPIAPAGAGGPTIAEVLPPDSNIAGSFVESYLRAPVRGLPPEITQLDSEEYDADLSLDFLGPPAIGVGTDRFGGVGFAGAISAYFSDLLGRHQFGFAVQTSGTSDTSFEDQIGAQVIYLNQENRFNWGAGATHLPYITQRTVDIRETIVDIDGQPVPVIAVDQLREIVTIDEAELISQYPISLNRRWEASASYVHLGFESEIQTFFIAGERVIGRQTEPFRDFPSLDYYSGSVAYVGDTSTFGFISPVRGHRYRFEAEATAGDLQFQTALADYRKYFFMRPATLAFRAMHYGRYGSDAEDSRISPLYLGRQTLVRGYHYDDFGVEECTTIPGSNNCPEFDRLIGSKLAVMNLELRAPLFGPEEFGLFELEFLPTEMLAFIDAGAAWTEDETPELEFTEDTIQRVPVFSAGVGVRMLLGGYLPIHLYYAYPFQRPEQSGEFGFAIAAGW